MRLSYTTMPLTHALAKFFFIDPKAEQGQNLHFGICNSSLLGVPLPLRCTDISEHSFKNDGERRKMKCRLHRILLFESGPPHQYFLGGRGAATGSFAETPRKYFQ
jgi:hypothetical protein